MFLIQILSSGSVPVVRFNFFFSETVYRINKDDFFFSFRSEVSFKVKISIRYLEHTH